LLIVIVLADRQREVDEQVEGEARLVAQRIGMLFCAGGPRRLTVNSRIGSPNPLLDWLTEMSPTVTLPEIRPMGMSIAAMAARSKSEKVRA
jgi:hypothetical protein